MKIFLYIICFSFFVETILSQSISVNDYFPSNIGNKWIYNTKSYDPNGEPPFFHYGISVIEVVGDTILKNSNEYKIFRNNGIYDSFFRVDSNNHIVYEFDASDSSENYETTILDFNFSLIDTILYSDSIGISFILNDSIFFQNNNYQTYVYEYNSGPIGFEQYYLEGIGKYSVKIASLSFNESVLKGCIIDNVIYGDTILTSVKSNSIIINDYQLFYNYPNPFNPTTIISYSIPKTSNVSLKIFDTLGKEVRTLVNEQNLKGNYKIEFNASKLSSGIYFYRLQSGDFSETKKLILLK